MLRRKSRSEEFNRALESVVDNIDIVDMDIDPFDNIMILYVRNDSECEIKLKHLRLTGKLGFLVTFNAKLKKETIIGKRGISEVVLRLEPKIDGFLLLTDEIVVEIEATICGRYKWLDRFTVRSHKNDES